jgi:hypothetical protein
MRQSLRTDLELASHQVHLLRAQLKKKLLRALDLMLGEFLRQEL